MPLTIGVGFVFVGLSLPYLSALLIKNFEGMGASLTKLAIGMGG